MNKKAQLKVEDLLKEINKQRDLAGKLHIGFYQESIYYTSYLLNLDGTYKKALDVLKEHEVIPYLKGVLTILKGF